jgi:hypothetical protein
MLDRSLAALLLFMLRPNGAVTMKSRDVEVIATTTCDVRLSGYEARLDLYFFYKVEYMLAPLNLFLLERALATSVASVLNNCDENNMPIYAVELTMPSHEPVDGGKFTKQFQVLKKMGVVSLSDHAMVLQFVRSKVMCVCFRDWSSMRAIQRRDIYPAGQ